MAFVLALLGAVYHRNRVKEPLAADRSFPVLWNLIKRERGSIDLAFLCVIGYNDHERIEAGLPGEYEEAGRK